MESENIVNSRPLTFVSIEADSREALTPNHFLLGCSSGIKEFVDFTNDRNALLNNYKKAQYLSNQFWKRWLHEYLPTLTRRCKWFETVKNVEVDDIVLIVDENLPRNTWPMGRVVSVRTGKDGNARSVTVKTHKGTIMDRPVVKIAVLDVLGKSSK